MNVKLNKIVFYDIGFWQDKLLIDGILSKLDKILSL